MSIYDELNGIKLDLAEYDEEPLAEEERKKWAERAVRKLNGYGQGGIRRRRQKRAAKWIAAAAAAAAVLAGVTFPAGQAALARFPFVAGLLESFAGYGQEVDYSAYKTQIGETTENAFGKLTLNEIIVDTDRVLITSTLEPSKEMNVEKDDVIWLDATVTVNGRSDLQASGGSGSGSDGEDGTYTTYQNIPLSEIPGGEKLNIKIQYDRISWWNQEDKPTTPPEPWTFDIQTSRSALLAKTDVIELNRTVDLINGEQIVIEKVISSPVSTLVYYERTKPKKSGSKLYMYGFRMISDTGEEVQQGEGEWSIAEGGYARYAAVDLTQGDYSLIPYDGTKGQDLGEAVPIRE
ncbi:DUF4179 domain-containing protein [Saccharibacillus deserti]|uniref:DUF4179 domain-containing protein n=1 Tax=Saccharibacillus deserti TaxID=1634444 RepID=UPI0015547924|nr:DUF4179 domain-containing protein [Saccharibacillus deserti]